MVLHRSNHRSIRIIIIILILTTHIRSGSTIIITFTTTTIGILRTTRSFPTPDPNTTPTIPVATMMTLIIRTTRTDKEPFRPFILHPMPRIHRHQQQQHPGPRRRCPPVRLRRLHHPVCFRTPMLMLMLMLLRMLMSTPMSWARAITQPRTAAATRAFRSARSRCRSRVPTASTATSAASPRGAAPDRRRRPPWRCRQRSSRNNNSSSSTGPSPSPIRGIHKPLTPSMKHRRRDLATTATITSTTGINFHRRGRTKCIHNNNAPIILRGRSNILPRTTSNHFQRIIKATRDRDTTDDSTMRHTNNIPIHITPPTSNNNTPFRSQARAVGGWFPCTPFHHPRPPGFPAPTSTSTTLPHHKIPQLQPQL
jgi:hypothetical protein